MKLCVVMPAHWSATLGGAEIQMRYFLEYLQESTSHQVSIVCRRTRLSVDNGVPIYRIGAPNAIARYSYLLDYPYLRRLLCRIDPDVIYTRVASPLVGYAARYCRSTGKALVHHIARLDDVLPRQMIPMRHRIKALERPFYEFGLRSADAIIAQAGYQASLLREHFRRDDAEIIPNYHPSSHTGGAGGARDSQTLTVLWVANLKSAKRPEAFVHLAERCRDIPNARFLMVGAIQDKRYEALLADAASLQNFCYLGRLPLDQVNALMESADVFVNTSTVFGEGFPNTFIQAWLHRTPVVSLEVNPDRLLDDRQLGVCSADSMDQFAFDVRSLLTDRARLQSMGDRAYQHARVSYSSVNLQRICSVLERCVDTKAALRAR